MAIKVHKIKLTEPGVYTIAEVEMPNGIKVEVRFSIKSAPTNWYFPSAWIRWIKERKKK